MVEKELHFNTLKKIIGKFIDVLNESSAPSPKVWISFITKFRDYLGKSMFQNYEILKNRI